jgi:hypothetical protein
MGPDTSLILLGAVGCLILTGTLKLVVKAGSVIGCKLYNIQVSAEQREVNTEVLNL